VLCGGGGGDGLGDGSGCVGSRTRQRTVEISRAIYGQYAIYMRFILIFYSIRLLEWHDMGMGVKQIIFVFLISLAYELHTNDLPTTRSDC